MNVLRRTVIVSVMIVLLLMGFSSSAMDQPITHLIIAGDFNYPPFEFISKDNPSNYRGLNVDVMRAISIETGIDIELVPMTWEEAKKALEDGTIDAIQGMTKTSLRESLYDFSDAYYISEQVIFVPTEQNDISNLDDLKGKIVAIQKGDINEEVIRQFSGVHLSFYPDQESALEALAEGRVSATLGNRATGIYHLQRLKLENKIKIVGETLSVNEYGVAVKKGNHDALAVINEGLELIKEKGTLIKINHKWFGETIPDHTQWKTLLVIVALISTGLFAIILFIFLINKRLHQQIEWRTQELKAFSKTLQQSDAQKWHILNNISNGIVVFDSKGDVTLFNQMASALIGESLDKSKNWADLKLCLQIGIEVFETALMNQTIYQGTSSYLNDENNTIHLKYDLTPIGYQEHHNYELILLLNDMTQDKIFHDVLNQNDKMKSLGRMSESIAHELRNPLNAVKQYIDMMPKKLDNAVFMDQALRVLPSELERLNAIIDGLLDYSKFTDSQRECVKLKSLIEDVAALMKVDFLHRRVRLNIQLSDVAIFVDPKQIKQIIINLLINSIEALPEDGGTITIIDYTDDTFVFIEVSDNGSGISETFLPMIFEPYFTTKKTGYGMGLAISKQLVEENQGAMQVTSNASGTTFTLIFPKYSDL